MKPSESVMPSGESLPSESSSNESSSLSESSSSSESSSCELDANANEKMISDMDIDNFRNYMLNSLNEKEIEKDVINQEIRDIMIKMAKSNPNTFNAFIIEVNKVYGNNQQQILYKNALLFVNEAEKIFIKEIENSLENDNLENSLILISFLHGDRLEKDVYENLLKKLFSY